MAPRTWTNGGGTPLSADNLNAMEADIIASRTNSGVSVKDYGAVGDGTTNDATAVQAALTAAAQGGMLNLPAGTYYMGSTPLTATLSGPLSIKGNGVATLLWDTGAGVQITQNNAMHTVTVDGVSLYTRAAGIGVALEIIGTAQNATGANLRPRSRNRGSITRVNIGGVTAIETDGWAKGIRLLDIMNFTINQVQVDGYAGGGASTGSYTSTHGIEMVTNPSNAQAVDVMISQCYVFFTQYALDVQGYEGLGVDQCNFIAVGTGFRFNAIDAGTPLATFTNGQIAFVNKGIEFIKINQGVISDSLIYVHPYAATTKPDAIGVSLLDTTSTRVISCAFVANTGMLTGVSITGASILNAVESCTFYSSITNPVNLGVGTSKNSVRNLILGGSQPIINSAGTANQVQAEVVPVPLQYAPTGAVAQTVDRRAIGTGSLPALVSGTMLLTAVWVASGTVINSATYISGGSPAASLTNRWFALYDANRNLIRTTADNTTAWPVSSPLTIPFSSSYTVPYDRLLYVGICEVATTPTTLRGIQTTPNAIGLAPILNGAGSTSLTNAASTPSTSVALTVNSNLPYAYVS